MIRVLLSAALAALLVVVAQQTAASTFPFGFFPTTGPFVDTCLGLSQVQCRGNRLCTWTTTKFPQCMLTARVNVRPPSIWRTEASDLVSKFFTFQFGMHLSEGKSDRRYYNVEVNECAALCLRSAAGLSDWVPEMARGANATFSRRRCLSFDFFPFELPMALPPHSESTSRGICVLNTETKATARLRPEDSSFTDAELFYISQPTLRPFSRLDGYYEVRDTRGSGMTNTLDFAVDIASFGAGDVEPSWGQSRNGISYLKQPDAREGQLDCNDVAGSSRIDDEDVTKTYFGGFTPTSRDGSCPGLVTKSAAANMCREAGGSLCPTQAVVRQLDGYRLGCNYDAQSIWAAEDVETNTFTRKYVRCCASYVNPPECGLYTASNADFCSTKTTSDECIGLGSGYFEQVEKGFGKLLEEYRARCARAISMNLVTSCRQLLMQPWRPRDRCVWCPGPGNTGQCRPGNNFGICGVADSTIRKGFSHQVRSYCPQSQLCSLMSRRGFSDLAPLFQQAQSVTTKSPTPRPTPPTSHGGASCGIPCRFIKGLGAKWRCKARPDCIWMRARKNIFPFCRGY